MSFLSSGPARTRELGRRGMRTVLGSPPPPQTARPLLGYTFAILTAMITAVAFILVKRVLAWLDPLSFSVAQFGFASLFALVWVGLRRELRGVLDLTPGQWTFLVVVSLFFLSAIYTMWIGLSLIPATAASLLNRLEVLVTVLLGMALLGERFTRREAMGAGITLLGVVILRYQAPPSFSAGFWMVVLSSALFGVTEILVKTRVHTIPPRIFVLARNLLVFAFFLLAAGWRALMSEAHGAQGFLDLEGIRRGMLLIALAALAGPVLARTLYMHALRHLDVSRAALVNQTQPLFVALLSALVLHTLPGRREWMGGILIVAGCILLVRWTQRSAAATNQDREVS